MRFASSSSIVWSLLTTPLVYGYNFPYEATQLTDADVAGNADLQFGNAATAVVSNATCKTFPGDAAWPSADRWATFNASLGGALVRTYPAGAPCYPGPNYNAAKCVVAKYSAHSNNYIFNDPAAVMATWAEGDTCSPTAPANSTCEQGGHTMYAVNVTSVKQIQLAVNFARNNNIRLVVKNTGHDFLGRSTGAGALGIWVHHLKAVEYMPDFTIGSYQGAAARLGIGNQAYDLYRAMNTYNITITGPITNTVGYAGFMQGGGHSHFTSYYGMGADQVQSIQLVTPDGKFVTADQDQNSDLFWAIRGGGGGNWGVVTSTVVKAYPATWYSTNTFTISTGFGGNSSQTAAKVWEGIRLYHRFVPQIVDAGGQGSNYINRIGIGGYMFTNSIWMPFMQPSQLENFTAPLLAEFKAAGIDVIYQPSTAVTTYAANNMVAPGGLGGIASYGLLASRLFPRANFDDETSLNATINAIRSTVEAGYSFHSNNYAPTEEVDNALNPALRYTASHATMFDTASPQAKPEALKASWDKFQKVFQSWRDVSPTAGCYMNEASVIEPNFQWAFYGENYPELQQIKKTYDPWGVFYVTTGVGSENWELKSPAGFSQNGKLCRLAAPSSTWSDPSDGTLRKANRQNKGTGSVKKQGFRQRVPARRH